MYNILFFVHVIISILLVIVILIQRGRGGGLVEALSGAESLFGTKTSAFLVKVTTILAIVFFITSTSLAFLSKQRERSLLERGMKVEEPQQKEVTPATEPIEEEPQKPQESQEPAVTQEQQAIPEPSADQVPSASESPSETDNGANQ